MICQHVVEFAVYLLHVCSSHTASQCFYSAVSTINSYLYESIKNDTLISASIILNLRHFLVKKQMHGTEAKMY